MDLEHVDVHITEEQQKCGDHIRKCQEVEKLLTDNNITDGKKIVIKEFLDEGETEYYEKAKDYWSKITPTVDGMLGGYGDLTFADIRGSTNFIQNLFKLKPSPERQYALDCGAGIGRVTKHLLMPIFERVDMVEQDKHFCDLAREYVGRGEGVQKHLVEVYNMGLQDFIPGEHKYDLIWTQWVLGHLKDGHLVEFFQRCVKGLKKNGVIVLKENFSSSDDIEIDATDSSVTRTLKHMKELIEQANLRIIREQRQLNFPKGLYPVYIIALKSNTRN